MNDGFTCPTIISITLQVKVGSKILDVSFTVIPTLNQIHVNLGHPWLKSMKVAPSIVHKYLKFPFEGQAQTIFIVDSNPCLDMVTLHLTTLASTTSTNQSS